MDFGGGGTADGAYCRELTRRADGQLGLSRGCREGLGESRTGGVVVIAGRLRAGATSPHIFMAVCEPVGAIFAAVP